MTLFRASAQQGFFDACTKIMVIVLDDEVHMIFDCSAFKNIVGTIRVCSLGDLVLKGFHGCDGTGSFCLRVQEGLNCVSFSDAASG